MLPIGLQAGNKTKMARKLTGSGFGFANQHSVTLQTVATGSSFQLSACRGILAAHRDASDLCTKAWCPLLVSTVPAGVVVHFL